jgi:hypothetical protein
MLHTISHSLTKHIRATCTVTNRVYVQPKRRHWRYFPTYLPHPNMKAKRDIFICVYKLKKTMYSNQMGLFPQVSSLGNKYIMVIHDVDSNSLWAESLKNNTGGKLILGCAWALERMRKGSIVPKHQVPDN